MLLIPRLQDAVWTFSIKTVAAEADHTLTDGLYSPGCIANSTRILSSFCLSQSYMSNVVTCPPVSNINLKKVFSEKLLYENWTLRVNVRHVVSLDTSTCGISILALTPSSVGGSCTLRLYPAMTKHFFNLAWTYQQRTSTPHSQVHKDEVSWQRS